MRAGVKLFRAVLAIERAVTPPGSWVPDKPVSVDRRSFVDSLGKRMSRRRHPLRRPHSSWPPSPAEPNSLSAARARLAVPNWAHWPLHDNLGTTIVPHRKSRPPPRTPPSRSCRQPAMAVTIIHQVPNARAARARNDQLRGRDVSISSAWSRAQGTPRRHRPCVLLGRQRGHPWPQLVQNPRGEGYPRAVKARAGAPRDQGPTSLHRARGRGGL